MHPWCNVLASYIKEQLPDIGNTSVCAMMLIQRFCEAYNIKTVTEGVQVLSQCRLTTIKEISSQSKNFSNDLNPQKVHHATVTCSGASDRGSPSVLCRTLTDKEEDINSNNITASTTLRSLRLSTNSETQVILVARFKVKDNGEAMEHIYLTDSSGSILNSTVNIHPQIFDQPVLLTSWSYIIADQETCRISVSSNIRSDILRYIEAHEVIYKPSDCMLDTFSEYISITQFLCHYKKQKYNHLEGIVIAKSPVHKLKGHAPFFFIWFQCCTEASNIVAVVVQETIFTHWNQLIQINSHIRISNIKRNILKKRSEKCNGLKVFCTSKESKVDIISHLQNVTKVEFQEKLYEYMGTITSDEYAEFGVYKLEGNVKLLLSHQSHLNMGRGFRIGAMVKISNAHCKRFKMFKVLCCCTLTTVEVVRLSKNLSAYKPFITQHHSIVSFSQEMPYFEYLWMIECIMKIFQNVECTQKKGTIVYKILSRRYLQSPKRLSTKRDAISEFMDLPHNCIFNEVTQDQEDFEELTLPFAEHRKKTGPNRSQDALSGEWSNQENYLLRYLPELLLVGDVLKYCRENTASQQWFNGMEFDVFRPLCKEKDKWLYCCVDMNSLNKRLVLCGNILKYGESVLLNDRSNYIHIFSLKLEELQLLNGELILVEDFKVILEKFKYTQFVRATGQCLEKEHLKAYIFIPSVKKHVIKIKTEVESAMKNNIEEINSMEMETESSLSSPRNFSLEPVVKQPKCGSSTSNSKLTISGYVVSREFKRNRDHFYDVESHKDGLCFITKHGRVNPDALLKTNTSLYPFATSVLIVKLQQQISNTMPIQSDQVWPQLSDQTIKVYIDSNQFRYPFLLYTGAKVKFVNVLFEKSGKTGKGYLKLTAESTLEIQHQPPFVLTELKTLIDQLEKDYKDCKEKRDLISFVHDTLNENNSVGKPFEDHSSYTQTINDNVGKITNATSNTRNTHTTTDTSNTCLISKKNIEIMKERNVYITACISFVQSIVMYWRCTVCHREVLEHALCELKCRGKKQFCARIRNTI